MNSRKLILILIVLSIPVLSLAQAGFEFTPPEETEITVDVGSAPIFINTLQNTGDSEDYFILDRFDFQLPEDWITFICLPNGCLMDTADHVDTLTPGEEHEITIDFIVNSAGTGSLWLKVTSTNDPSLADSVQYIVHAEDNDVSEWKPVHPTGFSIAPVWPNPFNSMTNVRFSLPQAGKARLSVYTPDGRLVSILLSGHLAPGEHQVSYRPSPVLASGLYLLKLEAGGQVSFCRAMLLK